MTRNAYVIPLLLAVLPVGCDSRDTALIDSVTFGVGLPDGAKVVATKRGPALAQDSRWYLIFDTDQKGIEEFALNYSGGVPLDQFVRSPKELRGSRSGQIVEGIPWNTKSIGKGRYFQRKNTNGYVSIDTLAHRVYVFR